MFQLLFLTTVFSPDYFYVQGYILGQLKLSEVYLATNEIFWAKLRILVFLLRTLEGTEEF